MLADQLRSLWMDLEDADEADVQLFQQAADALACQTQDCGTCRECVKRQLNEALELLHSPEKWQKWCDIRMLERCEQAEAQLHAAQATIQRLTKSDHA